MSIRCVVGCHRGGQRNATQRTGEQKPARQARGMLGLERCSERCSEHNIESSIELDTQPRRKPSIEPGVSPGNKPCIGHTISPGNKPGTNRAIERYHDRGCQQRTSRRTTQCRAQSAVRTAYPCPSPSDSSVSKRRPQHASDRHTDLAIPANLELCS